MSSKLKKALLVVGLAFGLAACGSAGGLLPPESLYPNVLTTCSDFSAGAPRPDKTKARTDKEKAQLTAGLYDSYMDCKTTVGGWKSRRERYVKQYESQNYGYFERVWRSVTGAAKDD